MANDDEDERRFRRRTYLFSVQLFRKLYATYKMTIDLEWSKDEQTNWTTKRETYFSAKKLPSCSN